ncbi:tyrosine-type recombinase/integrase [Hymenobacter sp. HMF4947]|uniref:Tyrosine-type recombinase/integrase n=1 Tax=Hymenobacter ginkgonis TaxID=2682976 RepID=A0A7K1TDH5_9BACT|nr:site-specific integrase [Hymenobacter ginkgonis]MVN76447.1 tyrosine-type recombinase/integrase [Hymenobacter ginkgonis]
MPSVSFLLKEPSATKPTPIFAFLSFDGQRVKISLGLSVLPKQWLKSEQRAQVRGYPDNGTLNDALDLAEAQLIKCYGSYRTKGQLPDAESLRAAVTPVPIEKVAQAAAMSFWEHLDEWVSQKKAAGLLNTARTYATAARHLREFASAQRYGVDFDTITSRFGEQFTAYLVGPAHLTDNTVSKILTRVKLFMKWAASRGLHTNTFYPKLTWSRREPDVMTLTADELHHLATLPLPAGGYLDNARGLFVLSCYTGLRYSDLVSIRAEHVRGTSLRLVMHKTKDMVTVPLRPEAAALVERMVSGELRPVANQVLNRFLKELGQRAELAVPVEVVRYRGGRRESETLAKWQRLTCHTGRRTFATLALEQGLRPELVMKITGHKSWASFKRYVNITADVVSKEFHRVYGSAS